MISAVSLIGHPFVARNDEGENPDDPDGSLSLHDSPALSAPFAEPIVENEIPQRRLKALDELLENMGVYEVRVVI